MLELTESKDNFLRVRLADRLTGADLRHFGELVERAAARPRVVRVLVRAEGFRGLTPSGAFASIGFLRRDQHFIEKVAFLSSGGAAARLAWLLEVLSSTIVEVFKPEYEKEAWQWLHTEDPRFRSRVQPASTSKRR